MTVKHSLTVQLSGDEMDALWQVHREDFPNATLEALGAKLIRDELVRMGVLKLTAASPMASAEGDATMGAKHRDEPNNQTRDTLEGR